MAKFFLHLNFYILRLYTTVPDVFVLQEQALVHLFDQHPAFYLFYLLTCWIIAVVTNSLFSLN